VAPVIVAGVSGDANRCSMLCARHSPQVALRRPAHSSSCSFWHLLTREKDYAIARPRDEPQQAAPARVPRRRFRRRRPDGIASSKSKKLFDAERELSRQAKSSIGGSSASGKREATRRTSAEQCSARELRGEAGSSAQA